MKTLYLELNMGAAGDMLMAALLELIPEKQAFIDKMNALGIPDIHISAMPAEKNGIVGTSVQVSIAGEVEESYDFSQHEEPHSNEHEHHHHHQASDHAHEHADKPETHAHPHYSHVHIGMAEIESLISQLPVSAKVRQDVLAVYSLIAEAESKAHGRPVDQVHFHELGMMDALADITGVCCLMEQLSPDRVLASPVHLGSGHVQTQHGILPVPAPATAYILQDVPSYSGKIRGELCTPTGAALLKHFVSAYGEMPVMRVQKIGYGMGKKDFAAANCLRAFWGESDDSAGDEIFELACNLDDMTPEAISFACEQLFEAGALDVYTTSIGMKKNRPGIMLSCLCKPKDREALTQLIFKHTSTLGVRQYSCQRAILQRSERSLNTKYGTVRIKTASGWGVERQKVEYEDAAALARKNDVSIDEIKRVILLEQDQKK